MSEFMPVVDVRPETKIIKYQAEVLCPEGLGHGDGSIGLRYDHDTKIALARELVNDVSGGMFMKKVDRGDDGCGDGRSAQQVSMSEDAMAATASMDRSKRVRAKVFGGGFTVATSAWRAVTRFVGGSNATLVEDQRQAAAALEAANISYGGHTDDHHGARHATDDLLGTGCGAVDKYPIAYETTTKYASEIAGVVGVLLEDTDSELVGRVFASYAISNDEYFAGYTGRKTAAVMEANNPDIDMPELVGEHNEALIGLNFVEGTTFDQEEYRQAMIDKGIDPAPQVFVVDVWRGAVIADAVAKRAAEQGVLGYKTAYDIAMIDFVARSTCGVAATLTDGSLPVIRIQAA